MANHDAVAALPAVGNADKQAIRDVLVKRMPYALADSDNPGTLVETDPDSGKVIIDILYKGRVFHVDATDFTTPGDGVTCLVTAGGVRYKLAVGTDVVCYSVLDRLTVPVGTEVFGDAILVLPAATGAFAGEDNNVAVKTARGWEFVDFGIGRLIYVEDEDTYYRRKTDGTWSSGFGNAQLGAGTIPPSAMIGGGGKVFWIIENQTTNAPPAVVNGAAYIIGSAPTGAWAGNTGKIAHGEGGAWVIYAPAAGWLGYDKSAGQNYQFTGAAWVSATGRLNVTLRFYTAGLTWNKPARLAYVRAICGGGGGNASLNITGTSGSTSSFGSHCSATGGAGGNGNSLTGGAGGTGVGGDINLTGQQGNSVNGGITPADAVFYPGGLGAGPIQPKGMGGSQSYTTQGAAGGGGGCSIKIIDASLIAANVTVTVGSAAQNNGYVMVEEYTYA
jgi:hypothetical protein